MVRISNGIITLLNLLTLIVSFCAVCTSLWLYVKVESPCEKALRMPLLVVGGALMAVSMAGLLGSCCRVSFFMWLYLITLFLLIVGLTAFTLFAIVVTNKGVGDALSGAGKTVGSEKLGGYSGWLQNHVINGEKWDEIRSCIVNVRLCEIIEGGKDEEIYKQLSPVQSGCCKPPSNCGLQMVNATSWKMPEKGPAVPDPDCKTWSNDQTQLCFNCESCKRAALDNIRKEWRMLAIFNSCILLSITIIYSIGCCALRNNQSYSYKKQRNYHA